MCPNLPWKRPQPRPRFPSTSEIVQSSTVHSDYGLAVFRGSCCLAVRTACSGESYRHCRTPMGHVGSAEHTVSESTLLPDQALWHRWPLLSADDQGTHELRSGGAQASRPREPDVLAIHRRS